MPHVRAVFFIFLLTMCLSAPIHAKTGVLNPGEQLLPQEQLVEGGIVKDDTYMEMDDRNDVIRFFVKGKLAAFIDETGLHVTGDIGYTGTITDTGASVAQ